MRPAKSIDYFGSSLSGEKYACHGVPRLIRKHYTRRDSSLGDPGEINCCRSEHAHATDRAGQYLRDSKPIYVLPF